MFNTELNFASFKLHVHIPSSQFSTAQQNISCLAFNVDFIYCTVFQKFGHPV
uniref:Uncharacterized protein n=1 Tax=Anguilla anguilla TaxID=7936 RepID=A0A0E9XMU9_ANGAN